MTLDKEQENVRITSIYIILYFMEKADKSLNKAISEFQNSDYKKLTDAIYGG